MILFTIIVIAFVVFAFMQAGKKMKKTNSPVSKNVHIPVTISYDSNTCESETYSKPIQKSVDGWILNPGTPFELTVLHTTKDIAQSIREICDNNNYSAERQLLSIFASNNISIKEIEEYKDKYTPIYNERLRQLIAESNEFDQMGIKDRDILMKSFRTQALDSIYELPDIDIEILFMEHDLTIDDKLITQYGFDVIDAYLSYFNKTGAVVSVDRDAYYRKVFEQMSQNGLAIQGKNIPLKEVLASQTLKTLNQIANNPDKIYRRKDQAIEYILSDDEKVKSIDDYVAFSELFKMIPLKELSEDDVAKILDLWDYYKTEIKLLLHTFSHSIYGWEQLNNDRDVRKRLYSTCIVSSTSNRCRCAQERMKNKYPIDNMPKTPCHLGCSCWINYNR